MLSGIDGSPEFLKPGGLAVHPKGGAWCAGGVVVVTCRDFVEFLMDYLSGNLPDVQRDEFDRHMADCVACVAYLKTYQETIALGKAAFAKPDDDLPDDVPEDLTKAILAARRAR
jgi:anti-sigma factor RsiW